MSEAVLDASAVLAWLRDEPGGDRVEAASKRSRISAVNLAEVAQRLLAHDGSEALVRDIISDLPWTIVEFDAALALEAGFLRRTTRKQGLSLGDRACLALAMRECIPVLTADGAWAELDLGVEVVLIR
jgi:PIN domain nuclease of toxin-antitoxin system